MIKACIPIDGFFHQISKADPMEKKFSHEELKVSKGKPPEVDPVSRI